MSEPTMISKTYTSDHFGQNPTIDQKILIFRDRVMGWQIEIAEQLSQIEHSGYAVLAVLASYFEMIEQYSQGVSSKGREGEFAKNGFKSVFRDIPKVDEVGTLVWERIRCGMYHSGYPKLETFIGGDLQQAVAIDNGVLLVNPRRLCSEIRKHFESFCQRLDNPANSVERKNFEKRFTPKVGALTQTAKSCNGTESRSSTLLSGIPSARDER